MALGDVLAKVKKAVKTGNEQTVGDAKSIGEKMKAIDEYTKATAPTPMPKPAPRAPVAPVKPDPKTQYGTRPGEKRIDTTEMTKPLGSFHKGGKVKKDGAYNLKKGEQVLTKAQQKKQATNVLGGSPVQNPAAGTDPDDMHISKLDDGSFSIAHSYNTKEGEPVKPQKFSAKNKKHLVRHVRAAYNTPTESPDAGDPGDMQ